MTRRKKLCLACLALAAVVSAGDVQAEDESGYGQCVTTSWAAYFQCRDWGHTFEECTTMVNIMLDLCSVQFPQK